MRVRVRMRMRVRDLDGFRFIPTRQQSSLTVLSISAALLIIINGASRCFPLPYTLYPALILLPKGMDADVERGSLQAR